MQLAFDAGQIKAGYKDRQIAKMQKVSDDIREKNAAWTARGCKLGSSSSIYDEEDETERYDRDDPCKAVAQIAKKYEHWLHKDLPECPKHRSFEIRKTEKMKSIRKKIQEKMECDESYYCVNGRNC